MENKKIFILWLTGLSGAGKTTLAKSVKEKISKYHDKVHHLDGDEVRAASKEPLGFDKVGRDKNIKLAIELAKSYQDNGYIVIASFISPYKEHRQWGKDSLQNYIEVFVDAPLEICELRDTKGMYKKARAGEISFFTGISDPYENPENPNLVIKTHIESLDECVRKIIDYLAGKKLIR